jgi:hypothetical protein
LSAESSRFSAVDVCRDAAVGLDRSELVDVGVSGCDEELVLRCDAEVAEVAVAAAVAGVSVAAASALLFCFLILSISSSLT